MRTGQGGETDMNRAQPVSIELEARPATLQFASGEKPGTIYARRVGGRIVEAYRGYGYSHSPLSPLLRNRPTPEEDHP